MQNAIIISTKIFICVIKRLYSITLNFIVKMKTLTHFCTFPLPYTLKMESKIKIIKNLLKFSTNNNKKSKTGRRFQKAKGNSKNSPKISIL